MNELKQFETELRKNGYDETDVVKIVETASSIFKSKKYGLVWEEKEEKICEDLKKSIPYLDEYQELRILKGEEDAPHHLLIEGDNLEALNLLMVTHKNKVNVCYIDPPYNTKNKDFKYNDVFIEEDNEWRHSTWLSFMSKRLKLAKELLSDDGLMFISIDEHEFAQLKLLCDEIFGEQNVETMIWKKVNQKGSAGQGKMKITSRFRVDHEYIIVTYKNKLKTKFNKPLMKKVYENEYGNMDGDVRGDWISCELCKSEAKSVVGGKNYYSITTPSGRILERQWHYTKEEFYELDLDNRIYWGNGKIIPRLKKFINEPQPTTPTSIISEITQTDGENDLKEIFGEKVFSYPKPKKLVEWILKIASNKEAVVLDFFAGSGTTGHAVLELNKEDGGSRQFILCTNNENNICKEITYERLKKVIEGYTTPKGKEIEGVPANLKYYKVKHMN